jgi:hypothetical protein
MSTSAEEIWSALKHRPDWHLTDALKMLRAERRPIYNRLLSFRFGVGVYPNQGFFKENPAENAKDKYFVHTAGPMFPKSHSVMCVSSEDEGYAMAVEELGLAGRLRDEITCQDRADQVTVATMEVAADRRDGGLDTQINYAYFVSYSYTAANGHETRFGNAEVVLNAPIVSMRDVNQVCEIIAVVDQPVSNIVVLQWQLLHAPGVMPVQVEKARSYVRAVSAPLS